MTIVEAAPAKINLALHVRARRADGYHEIETLFAFLRDGDTVTIEESDRDQFALTGPFAGALSGEGNNLVLAARDAFAAAHGPLPPLSITLDKHLPVASGIGGGSADAAATLRALARLKGIDPAGLADIALALGSDVPACLLGKSAVGGGRGERLSAIEGLSGIPVLLVNPGVAVSTAAVFRGWDGADRGPLFHRHPGLVPGSTVPQTPNDGAVLHGGCRDEPGMTESLEIAIGGRNDLEAPARAIAPTIGAVIDLLAAQPGVTLARMSGSGATCFALFENEETRSAARRAIAAARPSWWCLESTLA
ncbi:4-(cytidine 5'-diphospho)-2-C-methyl-D-erythritol kinase [Sphingomonas pruni]|uniref:4-(cytidine 5'-diphospho)-2-C-methyl-D-erythritol kinase n=1 Tax=Sphingomonas pruni TaxID=40683 RepID=UPI000A774C6A|nr:4-(cytidine 5'-diphospho)-2-C-methyl-D-erythritol kinase [Sphingomonas pruni]